MSIACAIRLLRPAALILVGMSAQASAAEVPLPRPPGPAVCSAIPGQLALSNDALRYSLAARGRSIGRDALENRWTGRVDSLDGPLLRLTRADRGVLEGDELHVVGAPTCEPSPVNSTATRAAERRHGVDLHVRLASDDGQLEVDYRVRLRDGTAYVRELYTITSTVELAVSKVQLLDAHVEGSTTAGIATGSPMMAADRYLGIEHPMSEPIVVGGRASAIVRRVLPMRAQVPVEYSTVIGVTGTESPRRGFQAYVESERAHPFRTFLHYNSWYDIGYFTRYSQAEALAVIQRYGEELTQRRGVTLDSFLFDDGWDDTHHLWQFHEGFPDGFTPLQKAAQPWGAAPGMWLSPWGGYGPPRQERLATAKAAGYEVDDQGLALSGPHYYALFHDTTLDLVRRYGVNMFKLDGTGSPDKVTPGSAFDSDFAAARELIEDLRAASPALFINLTTGTWPSPFWLASADSIWRGGEDHSFLGTGSDRQRWITYRDADTYGGIVRQGPLFPLNSLMLHGIIYARHARGLDRDPGHDFADEVWSYFASGTGLQELYVSPELLSTDDWDTIATAAKWARAQADVLRDSHWVGGDPARGEVYGWAAWMPQGAVLALRNPADHPQRLTLDLSAALELPRGAPSRFRVTRQHGPAVEGPSPLFGVRTFELPAHAVVVWDLTPVH
jgi:hypothetical protein